MTWSNGPIASDLLSLPGPGPALPEPLVRAGATVIDRGALSPYVRFALGYFRDPTAVVTPELSTCLTLDLTAGEAAFRRRRAEVPGASFTAWITWCLVQALAEVPAFCWREVAGVWYDLADPPVFIPVATGRSDTFTHLLFHGVRAMEWPVFAAGYRRQLDAALADPQSVPPLDQLTYQLAHFIGNLPQLRFTSLQIHRHPNPTGRSVWYFGQRLQASDGSWSAPLAVQFDHATTDPVQLQAVLAAFARRLASLP